MEATLTSKGQITIPIEIREKLHLKTGDILDFDLEAPFLKATRTIPDKAWQDFGQDWKDPWSHLSNRQILDELRGPVDLPPAES
jgi:AbrB family looped-hinge helix DNA binding protein